MSSAKGFFNPAKIQQVKAKFRPQIKHFTWTASVGIDVVDSLFSELFKYEQDIFLMKLTLK